jgi:glycerol-3-phosphate dehydrogenase
VQSVWAGIRPLAKDPTATSTAQTSREHYIEVSSKNLVTIAGGKWTTFRRMGADVMQSAIKAGQLVPSRESQTLTTKLVGASEWDRAFHALLVKQFGLDAATAIHLSRTYGTESISVAQLASSSGAGARLSSKHPYLDAEVVHAVRNEYAQSVVDVLARRTRLAFLDTEAAVEAVPRVTELMASELSWNEHQAEQQQLKAFEFLRTMHTSTAMANRSPVATTANNGSNNNTQSMNAQ